MTQVSQRPAAILADPSPIAPIRGNRNENPAGMGLLALLGEDLRIHEGRWIEPGFWAVALHRFGNWRMGVRPKLVRAPLTIVYRTLYYLVVLVTGIELPYTIRLGRRVRIWHHSGIILSAVSIGDDVQIRQNTTMGLSSSDRPLEIPTIGDRVDIGCGACILGAVIVGDDCKIGANAVVIKDIPAGATAVGVPARIIRRDPTVELP